MSSEPDVTRKMSGARSSYVKSEWYTGTRAVPDEHHIFSTIDEKDHKERKMKMGPGVSHSVHRI